MRVWQIIRNEKLRRRWGRIKRSTKPRRGGAPTSIRVKDDSGDIEYDTQTGVELNAGRLLCSRFKLARDAPICAGQLFHDFGYVGNTRCT